MSFSPDRGTPTVRRAFAVSLSLLALSTLSLLPVRAQDTTPAGPRVTPVAAVEEKVDTDVMARIREEGMTRSQLPQTLAYLTDVIGPRVTGSPGLRRANEWTKNKLTEWGLVNGRLEPWGPFGRGWTLERFSAQVIGPQCIPLIAYPKVWSPGWDGVKTSDVVYLDATDEAGLEKFKGKLKGKFVVYSPIREVTTTFVSDGRRYTDDELAQMANAQPQGPRGGFGGGRPGNFGGGPGAQALQFAPKRLQFLMDEGAALILDPARGDDGTVFVQQATVTPPKNPPAPPPGPPGPGGPGGPGGRISPQSREAEKLILPQVAVSTEQYNRIIRMIQAGEKVQLAVELKTRFNYDNNGMVDNVVAEIAGSDKAEEVVMCGGHIDSWQSGTGATDNGAGVAVCMEAVRILKALGLTPRRTIRIALWSGEEQGLFGSRAYVAQHFGTMREPKPENEKVSGYFNLDNGTGKIRGIYTQGNEAIMPVFAEWLKPFNDLGATTITVRNTGGTDHQSFDAVGIPGFQFIQDPIDYNTRTHHSNQDVYDRIQVDDMKQAAVIMAGFLYNAAMRDDKLPRKPAPAPAPGP